jgi:hypothetical protein
MDLVAMIEVLNALLIASFAYMFWSGQIVPRKRIEEEERRRRERHYWIADRFYASELTERPSLRESPSMREYPVLSLDEDADET